LTRTSVIRAPTTSPRRSRATVSTSGSSGTSRKPSPAAVMQGLGGR
jgi:hypothetical protein